MNRSVILSLSLIAWPALAFAATPEAIRDCNANRTGAGCATLLNQMFVCAQAPAITGCEALLAMRDDALAAPEDLPDEPIEPDVTPRAEGEMADDPSADAASGVAEGDDDGMPDSDPDSATDSNGSDPGAGPDDAGLAGGNDVDCPVIDSADWRAVVGPVDGADGLHLIVTGRVTLPTPAWTVALEAGMADRSAQPVQEVRLMATQPDSGLSVIQVLTDYDLRLETPAIGVAGEGQSPYRAVRVMCGAELVVELSEVELQE